MKKKFQIPSSKLQGSSKSQASKRKRLRTTFRLDTGDFLHRAPNDPILTITGTGRGAYLWIGNNAENDKACFATIAGRETLRALARNILAALDR